MSKFKLQGNVLVPGDQVRPDSYLMASRTAAFYDRWLRQVASGLLADLGCGERPLRPLYDGLVEASVGIDWPGSLHTSQVDVQGDVQQGIPLRSRSVDTALVSDVLEHLSEPSTFLAECHRVLRPGGCLIGNTPFMYWLHEEPHDYYRYTEFGLRHLLDSAGFVDVDVTPIGGGLDTLLDLSGKFAGRLGRPGRYAAMRLQRLWLRLEPALARNGSRPLAGSVQRFPLSYGFIAGRP